tara:strand:- start:407 stop:1597 length:1191 start_codon:yes stop_codon:yes gene_type:complete
MFIFNKLKSLIKIIKGSPLGLFIIIQFIISNKKTNIVKLFSSKFGHFLVNTEIFLREKYSSKENFIFFTEETIDNELLLNLWNKKIKIISYDVGFFLQKCSFFTNWKYYDLRDFTFPRNKKKYRDKNYLFPKKQINFDRGKYFTCSIRTSNYNKYTQLFNKKELDSFQSWRDTDINNFLLAMSRATSKKMQAIIINKLFKNNLKKKKHKNLIFHKNYDLEKIFNYVINSKFHLASSTGIDSISYLNNIPTAYVNGTLGLGFHSISFSDLSIFCPLNIYSVSEKKILSLKEHIKLLKDLQKKFNIDRLELEHQKYYGVRYEKQSSDEIYNVILEIKKLSQNKNFLKKKDITLQKKFWKIYPDKWYFNYTNACIFNKRLNKTIISPYFLRKYERIYFK